MEEYNENSVLSIIQNIYFWQDQSLEILLEQKLNKKETTLKKTFEQESLELKNLEEEINSIKKRISAKKSHLSKSSNEKESLLKEINSLKAEISLLDEEKDVLDKERTFYNNKISEFSNPELFAKFIIQNFEHKDGLEITNHVQNTYTLKVNYNASTIQQIQKNWMYHQMYAMMMANMQGNNVDLGANQNFGGVGDVRQMENFQNMYKTMMYQMSMMRNTGDHSNSIYNLNNSNQ